MKWAGFAAAFLFTATVVSGQSITIHDGITKTVYNSSSEWNDVSSQQHWSPCDDAMVVDDMCHVHLNVLWPDDGELAAGHLAVPFYITLFKFKGHITQIGSFLAVTDGPAVTWDPTNPVDATGHIGDPAGVQILKGTFMIDPARFFDQSIVPLTVPLHGWGSALFKVQAALDNGAEPFIISQQRRFWSNLDTAAPIHGGGSGYSTDGSGFGVTGVNEFSGWKQDFDHGWTAIGIANDGNMPMGMHIIGPTDVYFHVYSYGDPIIASPEAATQDCRLDPDLHHGIQGALLPCTFAMDSGEATIGGFHNGHYKVHLDPVTMGVGLHHIMLRITDTATGPSVSGTPAFSAATITNFIVTVDGTDGVQPVYPACSLQGTFGVPTISPGDSTMLLGTWNGATSLTVDPPVVTLTPDTSAIGGAAGFTVSPTASTTYTLTASNPFGSQSCLFGLTVGDTPPPSSPPPSPPPTPTPLSCSGTLTGTSTDGGTTVTQTGIKWTCQ
jgi:hypothetical protein